MFEIRITLHDQDDVNESMEMLRAFVLALLEAGE
jgi:hypothetical protein